MSPLRRALLALLLPNEIGDDSPPASRDSVALPFIYRAARHLHAGFCPHCGGQLLGRSELLDHPHIVHSERVYHRSCELASLNMVPHISTDPEAPPRNNGDMADFESTNGDLGLKFRSGARLALAREQLERPYSQGEMAAFLNVPYQTYVNWEKGIAFIRRDKLKMLKDSFGITFDWIGDGDPSGLREPLRSKVLAHKAENPDLFNERS
jgi:DNA-binding XRE family transcriptional regulator